MNDLTQHSWQLIYWFAVVIPLLGILVFDMDLITKVGKFFQFPAIAALVKLGFLEQLNGWHILWACLWFIGSFTSLPKSDDKDFPFGARILAIIIGGVLLVPVAYLIKACGAQIW